MSDPSRPASKALTLAQQALAVAPDSVYVRSEASKKLLAQLENLDGYKAFLDPLDIRWQHLVKLVPALHSKEHVKVSGNTKYATVDMTTGVPRLRSATGKAFVNAGFAWLPDDHGFASQSAVQRAIANSVRVEGPGVRMALGRLHKYYKKRDVVYKVVHDVNTQVIGAIVPFSREEAVRAVRVTGHNIRGLNPMILDSLQPLALSVKHDETGGIKISKKSSNGLPTEGDSDDPEAMRTAINLAKQIDKHLRAAYQADGHEGVVKKVDQLRRRSPHLTTCMGKCKSDVYTMEKYDNLELRFYNVIPRPIGMLCQSVTQVAAAFKANILMDEASNPQHNFFGSSLAYGNAERLFNTLQRQLDERRPAYSVAGDDSIYARKWTYNDRTFIALGSGDASSFDVTELGVVTEELHEEHRLDLAPIDGPRSSLWWRFMRERDTVIAGSLPGTMSDNGPSGGTYQSEVNSTFMAGMLERVDNEITDMLVEEDKLLQEGGTTPLETEDFEDRIRYIILEQGQRLGLTMKVEDLHVYELQTLKECLAERPFLYVGYYFHVLNGRIVPFCDLKRCLVKAAFPSGPNLKHKTDLNKLEAMRTAAVTMSMGVPPVELYATYTAMRSEAITNLRTELELLGKNGQDDYDAADNVQYLDFVTLGPLLPTNMLGLLKVLLKPPEVLWLQSPVESLSAPSKEEASVTASGRWADAEDESKVFLKDAFGVDIGEEKYTGKDLPMGQETSVAQDERPPTAATLGRPPPTTTKEVRERRLRELRDRRERDKAARQAHGSKRAYQRESQESAEEAYYAELEAQMLQEQEEQKEREDDDDNFSDIDGRGEDLTEQEVEDFISSGGQLAKGSL